MLWTCSEYNNDVIFFGILIFLTEIILICDSAAATAVMVFSRYQRSDPLTTRPRRRVTGLLCTRGLHL